MDRQLDTLLAGLAAEMPRPDAALISRIAADADRLMPGQVPASVAGLGRPGLARAPRQPVRERISGTRRSDSRGFGRRSDVRWSGWSSAAALAGCLLAGVWFGLAAPGKVLPLDRLGETGLDMMGFPLIGAEDALSGVATDREI
ncbi:MAG: hypothetical protein AAGC92_07040 [Pseudomonadota bacterium]